MSDIIDLVKIRAGLTEEERIDMLDDDPTTATALYLAGNPSIPYELMGRMRGSNLDVLDLLYLDPAYITENMLNILYAILGEDKVPSIQNYVNDPSFDNILAVIREYPCAIRYFNIPTCQHRLSIFKYIFSVKNKDKFEDLLLHWGEVATQELNLLLSNDNYALRFIKLCDQDIHFETIIKIFESKPRLLLELSDMDFGSIVGKKYFKKELYSEPADVDSKVARVVEAIFKNGIPDINLLTLQFTSPLFDTLCTTKLKALDTIE